MTLLIAMVSNESIWLVADRRLTVGKRVVREDAIKQFRLSASDGDAMLAYAGLGATGAGREPSAWMSSVARGHWMTVEQYLNEISQAMRRRFPKHLVGIKGAAEHQVYVPAIVGGRPRMYFIGLRLEGSPRRLMYKDARMMFQPAPGVFVDQQMRLAGSGASRVQNSKLWLGNLRRTVRAYEAGKVRGPVVADLFARLNYDVSKLEPTVGPNCIVLWMGIPKGGAMGDQGAQFYSRTARVEPDRLVPMIIGGLDQGAWGEAWASVLRPFMETATDEEFNDPVINEKMSALARAAGDAAAPLKPDDNLD